MVTIENILVQNPYSTVPANSDRAWFGNTVILTTTTTQRVTGVVTGSASASLGVVGLSYALCFRPQGSTTAPLIFTTPMSATVNSSGMTSFTAASSVVPGAGSWEVGMCASNNTATEVTGGSIGWLMVTN